MTQKIINIGNVANDGTGDPLREAFRTCNENFTELYGISGVTGIQNGTSNLQVGNNGNITMSVAGTSNVVVVSNSGIEIDGSLAATSAVFGDGLGGNIVGANVISANLFVAADSVSTASISITGNTATVTSENYIIGYRDMPQVTTFSTTFNISILSSTVGGKHYYGTGNIIVPLNSSVSLAIGTTVDIVTSSFANVNAMSGVTLIRSQTGAIGNVALSPHNWAKLLKVSENTWYIQVN